MFLINLPLALIVVLVAVRHVPETSDPGAAKRLDFAGATLGAVALGSGYLRLYRVAGPWRLRPGRGLVVGDRRAGLVAFVGQREPVQASHAAARRLQVAHLQRDEHRDVCRVRALGGVFFLVVVNLQVVAGYPPLKAGISLLPITILMLLLSARSGALATQIGGWIPMTVGPLLSAVGLVLLSRVGADAAYVPDVLPGWWFSGSGCPRPSPR